MTVAVITGAAGGIGAGLAREAARRGMQVVLADRDGRRLARYQDVSRERRTGYAWYGDWPRTLLDRDYPAWRARQLPVAAE